MLAKSSEMVDSFSEREWGYPVPVAVPMRSQVAGKAMEASVRNRSDWFKE